MLTLESPAAGQSIVGIEPTQVVTIAFVQPVGTDAVTAYYKTADGAGGVKERLLTRADLDAWMDQKAASRDDGEDRK